MPGCLSTVHDCGCQRKRGKKNCLEKQNLRLSGGLVTDSNNTCTPLDERIRDIHHRHETVENPVRLLQLNGL